MIIGPLICAKAFAFGLAGRSRQAVRPGRARGSNSAEFPGSVELALGLIGLCCQREDEVEEALALSREETGFGKRGKGSHGSGFGH